MANDAIITISDDDHDHQSSPVPKVTPTCSQSSSLKDKATTINDDECIQHFSSPKQPIKNLTFVTGSCILISIETRFLAKNVRIKSFSKAKIDTLDAKLSVMDLSRYDKIVLHIGGYDVDAKIGPVEFKRKYQSLLKSVAVSNSKLFISGLLPRKGKTLNHTTPF